MIYRETGMTRACMNLSAIVPSLDDRVSSPAKCRGWTSGSLKQWFLPPNVLVTLYSGAGFDIYDMDRSLGAPLYECSNLFFLQNRAIPWGLTPLWRSITLLFVASRSSPGRDSTEPRRGAAAPPPTLRRAPYASRAFEIVKERTQDRLINGRGR